MKGSTQHTRDQHRKNAVATAGAPLGRSQFRVGRRGFVRGGRGAQFGLQQTLDDVEVVPTTESKAVLEHRAPETSRQILHRTGAELI